MQCKVYRLKPTYIHICIGYIYVIYIYIYIYREREREIETERERENMTTVWKTSLVEFYLLPRMSNRVVLSQWQGTGKGTVILW